MSEQQYLLEMLDIDKQFPGVKALNHARLLNSSEQPRQE